jgi:hypothetical protein
VISVGVNFRRRFTAAPGVLADSCLLIALTIGHHFSISGFTSAASACLLGSSHDLRARSRELGTTGAAGRRRLLD